MIPRLPNSLKQLVPKSCIYLNSVFWSLIGTYQNPVTHNHQLTNPTKPPRLLSRVYVSYPRICLETMLGGERLHTTTSHLPGNKSSLNPQFQNCIYELIHSSTNLAIWGYVYLHIYIYINLYFCHKFCNPRNCSSKKWYIYWPPVGLDYIHWPNEYILTNLILAEFSGISIPQLPFQNLRSVVRSL